MITTFRLFLVGVLFLTSACASCQSKKADPKSKSGLDPDKVLIVYLSRTNNTKAIAEIIHENVGGTLVAFELVKPYPDDYKKIVQQVVEENETGFLPPLKTKVENFDRKNSCAFQYECGLRDRKFFPHG